MNTFNLKKTQHGSTLIEVIVSIFVLTFGILVLMVAQLRSLASVQEAGNQTVVSQAAQTLMEGMLVNPTVSIEGEGDNKRQVKKYDLYTVASGKVNCSTQTNANNAASNVYNQNTVLSKADLARAQLKQFSSALCDRLPNAQSITAQVTKENNSDQYRIHVAWSMKVDDANHATSGPDHPLGLENGMIEYTFDLPVQ